jgi:archaellum component FlaC
LGITDKISDRLAKINFPNYSEKLSEAMQELERLEEREKQLAIVGKNYQTLWQSGDNAGIESTEA